jgi:hypothetical protein
MRVDVTRIGDLDGERKDQLSLKWAIRDAVLQGHTVQKLHDNEGLPVVLSDFMDRANA